MSRALHCAKLGGCCFSCSWPLDSPCDVSFQIHATKCVRQSRCFRCVPAVSIVLIRAICVGFGASDSAGASAGAAGVSSAGAPRSVSHSPHCAYCLLQGSAVLMRSCLRCRWQARVVLFALAVTTAVCLSAGTEHFVSGGAGSAAFSGGLYQSIGRLFSVVIWDARR
jgi:hypothetical protein